MRVHVADKRPALGRGLSALIPDTPRNQDSPAELDLDLLRPNKFQPRVQFDDDRLDELARSIRSNGVIQPILVRRQGAVYEIIAGERRWRAAQRAGLLKVPVIVRDVPDEKLLEVALIENVQREDLNPIDEAHAYQRLGDEFGLTQEQIAGAVGKDRSSVANYLRLLKLPQELQRDIARDLLSMGHARAILGLDGEEAQLSAAKAVIAKGLSVRETEALVRRLAKAPEGPRRKAEVPPDVHTRQAEERLRLALGTRVRIVRTSKGGRLEIDFVSEAELQRLYEYLTDRA
jgi:ParB family chromosome partitioning protein